MRSLLENVDIRLQLIIAQQSCAQSWIFGRDDVKLAGSRNTFCILKMLHRQRITLSRGSIVVYLTLSRSFFFLVTSILYAEFCIYKRVDSGIALILTMAPSAEVIVVGTFYKLAQCITLCKCNPID